MGQLVKRVSGHRDLHDPPRVKAGRIHGRQRGHVPSAVAVDDIALESRANEALGIVESLAGNKKIQGRSDLDKVPNTAKVRGLIESWLCCSKQQSRVRRGIIKGPTASRRKKKQTTKRDILGQC